MRSSPEISGNTLLFGLSSNHAARGKAEGFYLSITKGTFEVQDSRLMKYEKALRVHKCMWVSNRLSTRCVAEESFFPTVLLTSLYVVMALSAARLSTVLYFAKWSPSLQDSVGIWIAYSRLQTTKKNCLGEEQVAMYVVDQAALKNHLRTTKKFRAAYIRYHNNYLVSGGHWVPGVMAYIVSSCTTSVRCGFVV